jgi:hypothetical protein
VTDTYEIQRNQQLQQITTVLRQILEEMKLLREAAERAAHK